MGAYAFAFSDIKAVHLPLGVRTIGDRAFERCFSLESIVIPEGLEYIGYEAFSNCTSLKTVDIPSSLRQLASFAFYSCDSIEYTEHEGGLYLGNEANPYLILVSTKDKDITSLVIHEQTRFIHSWALIRCYALEQIVISKDIICIGESAFYECDALTIYCEAKEQPEAWESAWNASECPVVWGYTVK